MTDRGAAAAVLVGVAAIVLVLAAALGQVAVLLAARAQAQAAADAAALAAAPLTFRAVGTVTSPATAAGTLASANGARLVWCRCRFDPSFAPRTVEVSVFRAVRLPIVGEVGVRASARAEFTPTALYRPG